MPDPGPIVLTPVGYVLVSRFPGIAAYAGSPLGGTAILTSFLTTISGGLLSMQPGNSSGVPGLATMAPTGSNGRAAVTTIIGSGANDASAYITPPVTRSTIATDVVVAVAVIGRASGDRSPVLPSGQVYRGGFPVTAPGGVSTEMPGQPAGSEPGEQPAGPLRIRLRRPPRPLAPDASGYLVKSNADRVP
jgi:hypothetical protein